jgi:hypothetical protein
MRRAICLLLAIGTGLVVAPAAPAAVSLDFSFAEPGSGTGQLSGPSAVAVNFSTGHVYVADSDNRRVQEFDAAGAFVRMWGNSVNQTSGGDICPLNPGDVCQAGIAGGGGGEFGTLTGIAVDNSGGAAGGSVYVLDSGNNRVQRFTGSGQFVLAWGKNVDLDTGGHVCTAVSGHTCKAGNVSGVKGTGEPPAPDIPSEPGQFGAQANGLAVDGAGNVYVGDPNAIPNPRVQKFDSAAAFLGQVAPGPGGKGLGFFFDLAVDAAGNLYIIDLTPKRFDASDFSASTTDDTYDRAYGPIGSISGGDFPVSISVDPTTGFPMVARSRTTGCQAKGGGAVILEYHPGGQQVDCTDSLTPSPSLWTGIAIKPGQKMYVTASSRVHVFDIPAPQPPVVGLQRVEEITLSSAAVKAPVTGNLADTAVRVEYGTAPCAANPCSLTTFVDDVGASLSPVQASVSVAGLQPDTTYYYRVVATNSQGTVKGTERTFHTYPEQEFSPACANNLARQQSGAAFLLDCRAYELVSASDQGGYNVTSDLVPGQVPFEGFPSSPGRALYSVKDGGIPGTGVPTNRGPDPYLAMRDEEAGSWDTTYVGIPADAPEGPLVSPPFSSTLAAADASLRSFVFSGPEICDPCFADGSTGIPVRGPDGALVQGMVGSLPVPDPDPSGEVREPVSADGTHLVFGSTQQFEPLGNISGTDLTIYDRDLVAGTTQVVSTLPNGDTIVAGPDVAALDVSDDGSRILIGRVLSTDPTGTRHYHLYLHQGTNAASIDLTPGAAAGALYAGMSDDGSQIYFTTMDALTTVADQDIDSSADLYRYDVSAGQLVRVSAGTGSGNTDACSPAANSFNVENWNVVPGEPSDCSVVAIGGGGGISGNGGAYFLSPETLDGNGVAGAPSLFHAQPGDPPAHVATLESSASKPLGTLSHNPKFSFGTFVNPEAAVFDPVDGSMYILDNQKTQQSFGAYVQKFDSSGKPVASYGTNSKLNGNASGSPFLSFGDGAAIGSPVGLPSQIAVDTRPVSPNYRDLYVPDFGNKELKRFSAAGAYEAKISVGDASNRPVAVAVDPANGNVFVSVVPILGANSTIYVFDPAGAAVAPVSFAVPGRVYSMAIDSTGTLYVANGQETRIYDTGGAFSGVVLDSQPAYGLAVDPTDDHVYVNRRSEVVEYDAGGSQVGPTFGAGMLSDSVGLAARAGTLAITDPADGAAVFFSVPEAPPDRGYDNPLVISAVQSPSLRRRADFQVSRSGENAVFPSILDLSGGGFDSAQRHQLFRYAAGLGQVECVSCNTTGAEPTSDAVLPSYGLGVTDAGEVFFTTGEPLVLRDANSKRDAYEWKEGQIELISTGQSPFDSGLLSVTADGTDAFFFTRETLVSGDENGNLMKLYTARRGGGFFVVPPPPPCAASDECHGPGTQPAPPARIPSLSATPAQFPKQRACRKGKVKRNGKCVKRAKRKGSKGGRKHASNGRGGRR